MPTSAEMPALAKKARARLLQMHYEAKVGHLGGDLSCLDALLVLHLQTMQADDVLVLSKGHSAGALYIALWMQGRLSEAQLKTFHKDRTHLADHPVARWHDGIRFATGSLGHGLSLAAGTALSKRLQGQNGQVYCLASDGEWQEGSTWEGLIFAAHHRLANLTVMVDLNGLQGFGRTEEVASMGDLPKKIQTFGVDLLNVDGHDLGAISQALAVPARRPKVIILQTVKGHGISFMQDTLAWHYLPLTEAQYRQAMKEVSR